jgi:hypothetical protein
LGAGAHNADFAIPSDAGSQPHMQHRPNSTRSEAEPNNGQRDSHHPDWALAQWVLMTPAGLKPSMVLKQNLPEPSFTQDCVSPPYRE